MLPGKKTNSKQNKIISQLYFIFKIKNNKIIYKYKRTGHSKSILMHQTKIHDTQYFIHNIFASSSMESLFGDLTLEQSSLTNEKSGLGEQFYILSLVDDNHGKVDP